MERPEISSTRHQYSKTDTFLEESDISATSHRKRQQISSSRPTELQNQFNNYGSVQVPHRLIFK